MVSRPAIHCHGSGENFVRSRERVHNVHDIADRQKLLSILTTFIVAAGILAEILCQGTEARRTRDDEDRLQIIVDADYTGRFTTNIKAGILVTAQS